MLGSDIAFIALLRNCFGYDHVCIQTSTPRRPAGACSCFGLYMEGTGAGLCCTSRNRLHDTSIYCTVGHCLHCRDHATVATQITQYGMSLLAGVQLASCTSSTKSNMTKTCHCLHNNMFGPHSRLLVACSSCARTSTRRRCLGLRTTALSWIWQ